MTLRKHSLHQGYGLASPARRPDQPISHVAARLKERIGWQKACEALSHKHARIVGAMLVRDKAFDASHVSRWPAAEATAG